MKLSTFASAVLIVVTSCRSGDDNTKCAENAPLSAIAFTPTNVSPLIGEFQLTQVNTADVALLNNTVRTQLSVAVADSSLRTRSLQHRLGHIPRPVQLIGTRTTVPKCSTDSVEFYDGQFTIGCVDCTNTSPDYFSVTTANANGFWGKWVNNRTGATTFFVDDDPNAPHPSGYFCAVRKAK